MADANILIENSDLPGVRQAGQFNTKLPMSLQGTAANLSVGGNLTVTGTLSAGSEATTSQVITAAAANAFTVGANGTTNPQFNVDTSTASVATGLNVKGAAAGGGLAMVVTSSGSNESATLDARGTGTFGLNTASITSGLVTIGNSTSQAGATLNGALNVVNATSIAAGSQGNALSYLNFSGTDHGLYVRYTGTPATNRHALLLEATNTTGTGSALHILDSNASTTNQAASIYLQSARVGNAAVVMAHSFTSNTTAANPLITTKNNGNTAAQTVTAGVADGLHHAIQLAPQYTAATAQTVTRHNYLDFNDVVTLGVGPAAVTDSAVIRFNAAAGTHKAVDGATTKTTPTTVNAWMKINVNGTLYYIPAYTSKTS